MTDENAEVEAVVDVLMASARHIGDAYDVATALLASDWLAAREAAARAEALREAADGLYLNGRGQHNEGAKNWLHRRANLIDPRTRGSVCEHGYSRSVGCDYCAEDAARLARSGVES